MLCPPGALNDRWSRGFPEPVTAMASGWMRVRQRARQGGVELPLVLSDHADWDELTATIHDMKAPRLWVTHGREEALVHYARSQGVEAEALSLVGVEEERLVKRFARLLDALVYTPVAQRQAPAARRIICRPRPTRTAAGRSPR